MSFTCGVCRKPAPAGTRCTFVKVATKEITHPFRGYAQKTKDEMGRVQFIPDEGGRGVQTVKEIKVCIKCAPKETALAGT